MNLGTEGVEASASPGLSREMILHFGDGVPNYTTE